MIRSTEQFRAVVKAARRVGTPLVAVRTADPASAITQVREAVNGKQDPPPLVMWDFVGGLQGRNDAGKSAVAKLDWVKAFDEEKVPETIEVQKTMESMIKLDGAQVLFPTSFGYFDPHILKVAPQFPNTLFLHCGGLYSEGKHPKNVGSYFGYIDESQYVAGIVAGGMSKSGKLGFVAAKPIPQVRSLQCPNCGGTIELRGHSHTISAVCIQCLSILDASTPDLRIVQQFQARERFQPIIPLGRRGKLWAVDYEAIGFQIREIVVEGVAYRWAEYLLYNPFRGYLYLTEYQGHWNAIRTLRALPQMTTSGSKKAAIFAAFFVLRG